VQLPVIPLGVDCEAYEDRADRRAAGREIRRKLGVGDDELVVLFVGRLSYHAKAHPLPMYRALEIAAQRSKKQLWLLQVGWFPNETIGKHFTASARNRCPSVRSVFLDGQKPDVVRSAWFAADIFTRACYALKDSFAGTESARQANASLREFW
jgi:glycosyltransferase involved in cell wall biosynthesis